MEHLIDDLLAFSRLGRRQLHRSHVDVTQLVTTCIQELSPEAAGRDVTWAIGNLGEAEADAHLLRLVFLNLLSNALKFTRPRERAEIEVGARAENGEAVFFVRDNGVGYDMRYGEKLFGVFQRLHRADDFEGTGIGLAHVRRIVKRHGGRVWAEGEVERGARFYFTVPQIEEKRGVKV